jgi:hypothetical protein
MRYFVYLFNKLVFKVFAPKPRPPLDYVLLIQLFNRLDIDFTVNEPENNTVIITIYGKDKHVEAGINFCFKRSGKLIGTY